MAESYLPVVFGVTLADVFGDHKWSEAGLKRLRELGIDPTRKLEVAYPFHTWPAAIEIAATDRFPKHERMEAIRALAVSFIQSTTQSIIGKAMTPLARLIGPKRMLERMSRNLRMTHNFIDATLRQHPERGFLLDVFPVPEAREHVRGKRWEIPEFMQAALTTGLKEFTGLKTVQMEIIARLPDEMGFTFHIDWKD